MRRGEHNPFLEATFGELSQAIGEAMRALEERRFRSPAEKEAFAERLRFLLMGVAMRFSTGETMPGSPEMPLDRDPRASVAETFLDWYRLQRDHEVRCARRYTMWRAASFVLGREAYRFLELPDARGIVVLAISARAMTGTWKRCYEAWKDSADERRVGRTLVTSL